MRRHLAAEDVEVVARTIVHAREEHEEEVQAVGEHRGIEQLHRQQRHRCVHMNRFASRKVEREHAIDSQSQQNECGRSIHACKLTRCLVPVYMNWTAINVLFTLES